MGSDVIEGDGKCHHQRRHEGKGQLVGMQSVLVLWCTCRCLCLPEHKLVLMSLGLVGSGWVVDLLVGRKVGCFMLGRKVGWQKGQLVGWLVGRKVCWLVC